MIRIFLMIYAIVFVLCSCTGAQTFTTTARAGDTIAAAFSISPDFDPTTNRSTRDNTVITITDANNSVTTYYPGDTHVRAIMNMYPDPISYLLVATETGANIRGSEMDIGVFADASAGSRDWFQAVAFIDMPDNLATGIARVKMNTGGYIQFATVNIISGVGEKHDFITKPNPSNVTPDARLQSLERSPYSIMTISGPNKGLVNGIDITFTHNADKDNGGQGKAHVVTPRGDISSINWSDTGTLLHVLVTPANEIINTPGLNLKFYVAGGLTGLAIQNAVAYDINGNKVSDVDFRLSPLAHTLLPSGPAAVNTTLTLNGDNFCHVCSPPDTDAWLRINDQWSQITPVSVSKNSVTFVMPANAVSGKGAIWVGTPAGETEKWFDIQ